MRQKPIEQTRGLVGQCEDAVKLVWIQCERHIDAAVAQRLHREYGFLSSEIQRAEEHPHWQSPKSAGGSGAPRGRHGCNGGETLGCSGRPGIRPAASPAKTGEIDAVLIHRVVGDDLVQQYRG